MKELFVVYCIDAEGPLTEPLEVTFERLYEIFGIRLEPTKENLKKIQNKEIDLGGMEEEVAKVFSPHLLNYNTSWDKIEAMLDIIMSDEFRKKFIDSRGNGIVYNWFVIDHVGFETNERHRDIGYGNIFKFYRRKINEFGNKDKIYFHFHPIPFSKEAHIPATSFDNSMY